VRNISIGKLRTYQLYERFKTRTHLQKVNTESLRGAVPKFWTRLEAHDVEFTTDLSQAILISHLDMISTVLNSLGIPNQEGFFEKDIDAKPFLTDGWQARVYEQFKANYNETLLLFYINHLDLELGGAQQIFLPAA
jgi:hypothetical protein